MVLTPASPGNTDRNRQPSGARAFRELARRLDCPRRSSTLARLRRQDRCHRRGQPTLLVSPESHTMSRQDKIELHVHREPADISAPPICLPFWSGYLGNHLQTGWSSYLISPTTAERLPSSARNVPRNLLPRVYHRILEAWKSEVVQDWRSYHRNATWQLRRSHCNSPCR